MNRTLASILLLLSCSATADTLLVVNKRDATLALVDPATMKVTGKIATGEGPHEVAVSDDGKIAVVGNYGTRQNPGTSLTVIDVGAKREVRRFALPGLSRPHGIQAVGSRFYITTEGSLAVARYDAAADRIDWIGGTGQDVTHMLVVTRDEKKIYTSNIGSNSVSVLDLTNAPGDVGLKQIVVARGPEGIDLAPDGSALWVAGVARRNEEARISVIDPKTDSVVRTISTTTKLANRLKFTPDGTRVVISDPGTNEVSIFDAATGNVIKKIPTAEGPSGILITPDGKRLFVACTYAGKVQVIDTATWSIAGEVATGTEPDGLAYARK
ncbi:MAG TPA: YncE family protein [Thermoanaerobaculia bacterium]|nr:YncE family protein [Thermoanaerobaculia bacterium]